MFRKTHVHGWAVACWLGWSLKSGLAAEPTRDTTARYTHVVAREATDSPEEILNKAARLVPHHAQKLYHLDEYSAFIHFGPNTFTGVEWGNGKEDPGVFDPGDTLDTDQWCRVLKDAGMRKVIITAKHHDGFCLWQTRYNDRFSVRAVRWRDGKGDVLRELADSCRKAGLKLGVYLSPADLYQIENLETGLYGNESNDRTTVIPTAVDAFHRDPTVARADRPAGAPTFTVQADDYNRYFMNQLYELLTEYGPIHEVWFDGAHPKRKGGQTYAKQEWFAMIRALAPEAVIFGGPDIRWCGNEGGHTRVSEWSVLPTQSEQVSGEDRPDESPGSDAALLANTYSVYDQAYESRELRYLIAEVNTSIREGWFWRNDDEQAVRSPDDVFDIYERAVGGNAGFLLNVPPDRRGQIADRDAACLVEVGRRIRATYGTNLLEGATCDGAPQVLDRRLETYWQSPARTGDLIVQLPSPRKINRWVLQEAVFEVGQRTKSHALDAWIDERWQEIAQGTTVGFKKILRFPEVTSDRFRLRWLDSRLEPTLAEISAHYFEEPPLPVQVTRGADDRVVMTLNLLNDDFRWNRQQKPAVADSERTLQIVYTLDGTEPTIQSTRYTQPITLPQGGRIQARSIRSTEVGPVTQVWLGRSKRGWKIHAVSGEQDEAHGARRAIDGDASTFWLSSQAPAAESESHEMVIDLGEVVRLAGFTYLPPQRDGRTGAVEEGRLQWSLDGKQWTQAGEFRFGNLVNDPSERTWLLSTPVEARYVRLIADSIVRQGSQAGAAEIGILSE